MQMVAGRYPCMSDIPNMLPDTDMSSRLHMQPAHMRVQCRISFCMPDMHEPSVTPAVTCLGDLAITRTVHGVPQGAARSTPWWNSLPPFTGCTLIPNIEETLKRVYLLSRGKSTG